MSRSAAPCRVKRSGDEKRRLPFQAAASASGKDPADYVDSLSSVGPVHCGSAASIRPSPSLSKPSLHCTTGGGGGGGGVDVSPVQVEFCGLMVKALLSVTTQPVPSRLRTVTEMGVGTLRVPPAMPSPLPSQGSVLKVKPDAGVGTLTVIAVDDLLTIGAEAPAVGSPNSTWTLAAKLWPVKVTFEPTMPLCGLTPKSRGSGTM